MPAKKKTKYPASRQMQSDAVKSGKVTLSTYTTNVRTELVIKADISKDNIMNDLLAAVDDVLKYHGK